jgi:hypothetical protein
LFSREALRVAPRFTADLADALTQAGLEPETVKPELAENQSPAELCRRRGAAN